MALWILASIAFVLLVALVWLISLQSRVVSYTLSTPQPRDTPDLSALWEAIELRKADYFSLEAKVTELYKAVADGIDHVDRNEKRVRGIVVGATRRFENSEYFDAGVDAELDTLPNDLEDVPLEAEKTVMTAPSSVDDEMAGAASMVPGEWS